MNNSDTYYDPTHDDSIELEPSDRTSNMIVFGCIMLTIIFATIGLGSCILLATGFLKF